MTRGETRVARWVCAGNTGAMLIRALEDALMPWRCVFCGLRTRTAERSICEGCQGDLPAIPSPPPPVSSPLQYDVAPLEYAFPVDAAIKALKFRRRLFYVPAFADLLCAAADGLADDIDAIQPVPLHWRRRWYRGFNQAVEIARPVAKHLGVPLIDNVRRTRATPFQSGLSARERVKNLRSAFLVRGGVACYRHILIIDDVITTGATVRQVALALRRAGVQTVSALAIARAV